MTVAAPDLALRDLMLDRREGMSLPGELHNTRSLWTDMIELKNKRIRQATVDTIRFLETLVNRPQLGVHVRPPVQRLFLLQV